ncbi:MAG: hypothetical protein IJM30_07415 [Thermoguttaceae bacterium]|nr:hypothetical protein [Thermoguttaceae bacterium]
MTVKFMNRTATTERGVLLPVCFACATLAFFASAVPVFAQGNGSSGMRTVSDFIGYDETFQWGAVPEIATKGSDSSLDEYSWASDLMFRREIWQLKFSYKNMRAIDVDFPTKDGGVETKRVWYLVYNVTNTGERLRAVKNEKTKTDISFVLNEAKEGSKSNTPKLDDKVALEIPSNNLEGTYKEERVKYKPGDAASEKEFSITFVPRFVLASKNITDPLVYEQTKNGVYRSRNIVPEERAYNDQFLPLALLQIAKKEGRDGQELLDGVRISNRSIKPGETVWGVATWTDVDPRIDKFSVYISGLTNSLRWEVPEDWNGDDDSQVGAGREISRKTLKLNFFAPGDESTRGGKEIYNNLPGELDYQWIYL